MARQDQVIAALWTGFVVQVGARNVFGGAVFTVEAEPSATLF